MTWGDTVSGMTFCVTLKQLIAKNISSLTVSRPDGDARTVMLDDDVRLAVVRFVRTGDWLLVLNDHYALGGYNYAADTLVGEHHWNELPFTIWKGGGSVVAEVRVGQTDVADTPAGFPLIDETPGKKRKRGQEPLFKKAPDPMP